MIFIFAQVGALFTAPGLAVAGGAAVAIPVAIHLLWRLRRRPQPWAAMRFLMEAYRRHRQRLRLEQLLLLLVRCAIVALLGLALAQPVSRSLASWLHPGGSGREVFLVLDDSLPERALAADGRMRFAHLRDLAGHIVDQLGPNDELRVWRSAAPAGEVSLAGGRGTDRAALRSALAELTPGYARNDLRTALSQVGLALQADRGDRPVSVVVLSDFAQGSALSRDQPLRHALAAGRHGRVALWLTHPAPARADQQVRQVTPANELVLTHPDGSAVVNARVTLGRFGEALAPGRARVHVSLRDERGKSLAETVRPVTFAAGQDQASLNVPLPLSHALDAGDRHGRALTVRARLEGGADDPLAGDDQAQALVRLRRQLRVGIIAAAGVGVEGSRGQGAEGERLSGAQWLVLALAPTDDLDASPVRPRLLSVADLLAIGNSSANATAGERAPLRFAAKREGIKSRDDTPRLASGLDAIVVLDPAALNAKAWASLATFARQGHLVWVVAPPRQSAAVWVAAMQKAFKLPWHIGLEAASTEEQKGRRAGAQLTPVSERTSGGEAPDSAAAGTPLVTDAPVPDALHLLAADWAALLRPVRVMRRLPLTVPKADRWLALATGDDGSVWLAAHRVGEGQVLLLASALRTDWTNLPTKPLFVALVHQLLRGTLGDIEGRLSPDVVSGQAPALPDPWRAAGQLTLTQPLMATDGGAGVSPAGSAAVRIVTDKHGPHLTAALTVPGLYAGDAAEDRLRLTVNPDAAAGDLRQVSEAQLHRWLDGVGPWRFIDARQPAAMFVQQASLWRLGWPLLWMVLGLVLLETLLARTFSHAGA